jgi:hypothetical protein
MIEVRIVPGLRRLMSCLVDKAAIKAIGYSELSDGELINEDSMDRFFVLRTHIATHEKLAARHHNHFGFDY